jgi:hypothetical protein
VQQHRLPLVAGKYVTSLKITQQANKKEGTLPRSQNNHPPPHYRPTPIQTAPNAGPCDALRKDSLAVAETKHNKGLGLQSGLIDFTEG